MKTIKENPAKVRRAPAPNDYQQRIKTLITERKQNKSQIEVLQATMDEMNQRLAVAERRNNASMRSGSKKVKELKK